MKEKTPENCIFLASASPRRAELLEQLGLPFQVCPQDVDESFSGESALEDALLEEARPEKANSGDAASREASRLAERKLLALMDSKKNAPPFWGLGADTFIVLPADRGGEFLGKPAGAAEAQAMLTRLSGKTHRVITGIALTTPGGKIIRKSETTLVRFAPLSPREIQWYLASGEWEGAAGAYRIQGRGGALVESITGSYSNVVGLPLRLLYGILLANNYPFP